MSRRTLPSNEFLEPKPYESVASIAGPEVSENRVTFKISWEGPVPNFMTGHAFLLEVSEIQTKRFSFEQYLAKST
jgi:hypothetical protein